MTKDRSEGLAGHLAQEAPKNIPAAVRQAVLDRDHDQCQLCGTGGDNRLQLHHLEYRSQGGTHAPENLITLCYKCHEDVHQRRADILLLEVSPGVWASFPGINRPRKRNS
jgi:5-methylcytosine-specific restriction endonuclease McrA